MDIPESGDVARGTANRLKLLLEENDLTQQDASWQLHVPAAQLSRWMNGKHSLSAKYIIALCEHFNVSADWLLGLSDQRHPAPPRARTESEVDASAEVLEHEQPRSSRRSGPERRSS